MVLALSCIVFLTGLNNPAHPYWDENYYLTSTQRYVEGTAAFASHPPLGFMFMAAGYVLTGDNRAVDTHRLALTKNVGDKDVPKHFSYVGVRLPSALMAVVSCLLFYGIMLLLMREGFMAFAFSLLCVFENAFVIQFRAVQLDSYQIVFVMAGILVWLKLFQNRTKALLRDYALFGALIGLSAMVKVNSSVVLALGGISLPRDLWSRRNHVPFFKDVVLQSAARFTAMLSAFVLIVLAVFTLNTILTSHPPDAHSQAGARDITFMGQPYRDYVTGKTGLTPQAWWESIADYATYMKDDFSGVTLSEPNGQPVITWPFITKPISYRWDSDGKRTAFSTFVGNPLSWRLALIGLFAGIVIVLIRRVQKAKWLCREEIRNDIDVLEAVFAMYAIFMLIHAYLGLHRVMYIYHYFIGLILSFIILAVAFKIISERMAFVKKHKVKLLTGMSLAIALGFAFYAPFSYHQMIGREQCEWRNIPVHMFDCSP